MTLLSELDNRAGLGTYLDEENEKLRSANEAAAKAVEAVHVAQKALWQARSALKHRPDALRLIMLVDEALAEAAFHLNMPSEGH